MDLHKQILVNALAGERMEIVFPQLESSVEELLEGICHQTLQKIKAVIDDDSLDDEECFMKIEEIIEIFEEIGSDCGGRHDF